MQAFVYGFPYIYYAQLRHDWVTNRRDPDVVPYAAVNQFWHAGRLLDATYRDGGSPSTDSLYSFAWVDLREEPMILSHPDMGERYFTFQLAAFTSDNFGYVGQRTTGTAAGDFAIVGPGWDGDLPPGVRRVEPAPTPWVLVLGRTAVTGAADLPAARELQQQYRLTPLSLWGVTDAVVPDRRDVYAPPPASDPLAPWKTLNAMLVENPPPPHHGLVLDQVRDIGIGPGLDVEAQPAVVKEALVRAAVAGMALLRQQFISGDWAKLVNGWRYPPPEEGRFGDDFLRRAADQCLAGIAANDPAESVYLLNFQDADGAPYAPQGRYRLHFSRRAAAGGRVLVPGRLHRRRPQPDPQPGGPVLGRRPRLAPDSGRRRWAHAVPAAAGPRRCRGRELAADLRDPPVVPDPADVPPPAARSWTVLGGVRRSPAWTCTSRLRPREEVAR